MRRPIEIERTSEICIIVFTDLEKNMIDFRTTIGMEINERGIVERYVHLIKGMYEETCELISE